jgi:hypothetical protein
VFFQNSRHRLFSGIIKLFSFRKFGGIGSQSIDRAHGNGSMSPWDYIKSGSLIDGWVARIRTSEGVRTLLISSVDLKTNDPGGWGRRNRAERCHLRAGRLEEGWRSDVWFMMRLAPMTS